MSNTQQGGNNYVIPISIVIAGAFIAGAVFFSGGGSSSNNVASNTGTQPTQVAPQPTGSTKSIAEVTSADHIKGDLNAPVKIVEYSDYECPFCKRFHPTMQQAIDEYGDSGQVAWIYRHFPLDSLHPKNARVVAAAAECVAEQNGNDAFWEFTDGYFAVTPSNDRTDLTTVLPQLYKDIGANQASIEACIASGKYDKHIQDNIDNAIATGGRGTPWSVVIAPNGDTFPLSGAQPYQSVKQLIEIALKAK